VWVNPAVSKLLNNTRAACAAAPSAASRPASLSRRHATAAA